MKRIVMRNWLRLVGFVMGCLAAGTASALTLTPLDIGELADQAQLIVQGTVNARSCQRDETGRIYTRVEIAVTAAWKGTPASSVLTVVHGGGVLGERRTVIPGQVEYQLGEEVVAFLVLNSRGEAVTLGLSQGKFHVATDPHTGERLVRNPFHGGEPGASPAARSGGPVPVPLTLGELKRRVEERNR